MSILMFALLSGFWTQAYGQEKNDVTIYGSVINYGKGSDGIYSFNTMQPGFFTPIKLSDHLCAQGGGVLAGGTYYSINADSKTLYAFDADTWEELYSKKVKNVTLDMAYDVTTKQIYGCFVDEGAKLGILQPQDGTYKMIAPMQVPICIMVCDAKGVLYAVGHDGILYNVNKETAEMTEIGSTNIMPMFAQSAAIDPESGLCYWVSLAPDASSCLVELNLETGETGWIYDMPNGEEITGMFILPKTKQDAPAKASNLRMSDDNKKVLFTAPTTTVGGAAIKDAKLDYTIEVYTQKDRTTTSEDFTAAPGEELSYPIKETTGQIKISIIFKNEKGDGEKAILFFWMGEDTAGAVDGLNVSKESNNSARISWNAPKEGEHGGKYDKASLKYSIKRCPDNVVISENCTETSFIDNIKDENLKKYWYEVTPYTGTDNKKGVTARSNDIVLGAPYELPYNEHFNNTKNNFGIFTVIDANNNGETWYYDDFAQKVKYPGNLEDTADDWLITPPIHIEAGNVCSFSFYTTVGFDGLYTEQLIEVAMGNKASVKDMNVQLMPVTKYSSTKGQEVKVKFQTTKDDEYYFGIHIVSEGRSLEMSIDDIKIEKKASVEGPAMVSNFTVLPDATGKLSADISFEAPTTTYEGKQINALEKIELYRDSKVINTFNDVKPGDKLSFTDSPKFAGLYTYKVVAFSDKGSGDEAEIKKFVGVDVPGQVQNITLKEDEQGQIIVKWDAPTVGMNGGYIDVNTLKYTVLRNGWKPIAEATEETTAIDPMEDLREGVQGIMQYQILVKTDAGKGEDAYSSFITAGEPYTVPFIESFISGLCKYEPWSTLPHMNGGLWRYDKYTDNEPYDGDNGMMAYTSQNQKPVHSMMLSPKVRISDTKKPQLSFWLSNSAINDDMGVEIWADNKPIEMVKYIDLRKEAGWTQYIIDLTPYKDNPSIQYAFHITNAVKGDKLHIDDMRIIDALTHNLAAENIKAPISLQVGNEGILELKVANYGKEIADNYTVDFLNGDKLINQVKGEAIKADSLVTVKTTFVPQITDIDKMEIHAVVNYEADENTSNNTSSTVVVNILAPGYPTVSNLNGISDERGNNLYWSAPDMSSLKPNAIIDNFEDYESFTIENFGDWTLVDVDQNQYSMEFKNSKNEWITYPHSGGAMSFQVIDLTKIKATIEDGWSSISGDKILLCPYTMGNNDDWLISPELYPIEQEIVINAKSLNFNEYGLESFSVLYSTSDKETSSFIELTKATDIPTSWTEYRFTLPANAKYFAIRATGTCSALFLDDISFIPVTAKPMELVINGYNIYRNREKINEKPVNETYFTDATVEPLKEYTYAVTVMYDLGESGFSNEVLVTTLTGIDDVENGISIYTDNSNIIVKGATNQSIVITDICGVLVDKAIGSDVTKFNVQQGVYIVKIGTRVYKVMVK